MDSPAVAKTTGAAANAPALSFAERSERALAKLLIFWRLALSSLAIIIVVAGVNFYALSQLRQLTTLSTQLVSYHYPSIDTAKRLLAKLFAQLRSEKKYLVVRDKAFAQDFNEEADEFRQILTTLQQQESMPQGQKLLKEVDRLHQEYLDLFRGAAGRKARPTAEYETRRDGLMARITDALDAYVALHETRANALVIDSRARSARAEVITQHLIIAVLLLGMGLAGLATYSILYPLRQVQQHIRQIGQGTFGQSVKDRKSTRLNSSHRTISYAVFCLNASSTTDFSTLSLHDALPISRHRLPGAVGPRRGHYPAPHHRRPPPRNGLGRACDLQHTVSVAPGAAAHPADRPRDVRTIRKRRSSQRSARTGRHGELDGQEAPGTGRYEGRVPGPRLPRAAHPAGCHPHGHAPATGRDSRPLE